MTIADRSASGLTNARRSPKEVTILVVDDSGMAQSIAKSILEGEGYQVLLASNGKQCIDLHLDCANAIDLTILDYDMPGLTGADTFAELQKISPGAKVILSSGAIQREEQQRMLRMGLRGIVEKPYSGKSMVWAVKIALAP